MMKDYEGLPAARNILGIDHPGAASDRERSGTSEAVSRGRSAADRFCDRFGHARCA